MEMSNEMIQEWLRDLAEDIIANANRSNAKAYQKKFDDFVEANNVTIKQLKEFAESGAGETLYMLIS